MLAKLTKPERKRYFLARTTARRIAQGMIAKANVGYGIEKPFPRKLADFVELPHQASRTLGELTQWVMDTHWRFCFDVADRCYVCAR